MISTDKMSAVSMLVTKFNEHANMIGQRIRLAGEPYHAGDLEKGAFFILRRHPEGQGVYQGWGIYYTDVDGRQWPLDAMRFPIKKIFLTVAETFFKKYLAHAAELEKTLDRDIAIGEKAMQWLEKVLKELS